MVKGKVFKRQVKYFELRFHIRGTKAFHFHQGRVKFFREMSF